MTKTKLLAAASAAVLLSSCGGDSGSPPSQGGAPSLSLTLPAGSADVQLGEGEQATFEVVANVTGDTTASYVPDIKVNGDGYELVGSPTVSGNSITANFRTLPRQPGGMKTGTVNFRLCASASCTTVYAAKNYTVNLDVQLDDWGMFQRNPAHDAYVDANYDPEDFTAAWTWDLPAGGRIQEPSATRGLVFASAANSSGETIVYALNSADGQESWTTSLGRQSYVSGPSTANGLVYVTSMVTSSGTNPQWTLDAETGERVQTMTFPSQWHDFGQPTIYEDDVFLAAGYYGNYVYSFDGTSGLKNWEASGSGGRIWDGQSVAVDDDYVYYYSGGAMDVFDRTSGALFRSMADPAFDWRGYSWEAAPVLGSDGLVFGFSSPRMFDWDTKLAGYSVDLGEQIWLSARSYTTAPALAHGSLFAARHSEPMIDAISPADGAVAFSLPLPAGETAQSNLVVAGNLLFVATEANVYAFDLDSDGYEIVWQAEGTGYLAITPDNYLLLAGEQKLRAFKLH